MLDEFTLSGCSCYLLALNAVVSFSIIGNASEERYDLIYAVTIGGKILAGLTTGFCLLGSKVRSCSLLRGKRGILLFSG